MKVFLLLLSVFVYADYFDLKEYKKAYPVLKSECNKNDSKSCYKLGYMNEFGLGTRVSYTYAFKYYKKSCDLNDKNACAKLGSLYYYGLGIEKDTKKAEKLLKNACDNNIYKACDDYAYLYKKEYQVLKNEEMLKACSGGVANSCYELAKNTKDFKAVDLYLRACALEDELSCQEIAKLYINSTYITNRIANFSNLGDSECKAKNANACKSLANIYKELNNLDKAKEYFELACKYDDASACSSLAVMQEHSKEFKSGIRNYEKACELNDSYSCSRLANMYKDGFKEDNVVYIKKNNSKSKKLFNKACDLGYLKACK